MTTFAEEKALWELQQSVGLIADNLIKGYGSIDDLNELDNAALAHVLLTVESALSTMLSEEYLTIEDFQRAACVSMTLDKIRRYVYSLPSFRVLSYNDIESAHAAFCDWFPTN